MKPGHETRRGIGSVRSRPPDQAICQNPAWALPIQSRERWRPPGKQPGVQEGRTMQVIHPVWRIGNSNGIFGCPTGRTRLSAPPRRPRRAPSAPRPPASVACSTAARACGGCWTGAAACGRVEPLGCPGGTAAGRATWQAGGPRPRPIWAIGCSASIGADFLL